MDINQLNKAYAEQYAKDHNLYGLYSKDKRMNAYELADGLSKMYIETDNHGLFNKRIQNMLRQQADRIAELEKQLEEANSVLDTIDCGDSPK